MFEDDTYDITLLLGPMYHLFTTEDKLKALSEAIRVTKKNGVVFAAYCMGDASVLSYGFIRGEIYNIIEKCMLNTETFDTFSNPWDIFELHRKEDIDKLRSEFNVTQLHFVASDGYTNHMRETVDNMDDRMLNDLQVPTPSGKGLWQNSTIQSILSNEKYKGDAIINKTYIKDCLSKKVMVNNGERPKYYVENNHPAIIDAVTFGRVQEELARRSGKPKTKQVGTKTEQGKYSSKYAMTELLVCGECKTPYRRCTWTVKGQKKIVWRCINRLDFGKKYCHNSPTVEESILQRAVMRAIMETAQQNLGVLQTLKVHIGMGLQSEQTEDNSMELQIRIAEIDAEFKAMLAKISTDTVDAFDEEKAKRLMDEKAHLQQQLGNIRDGQLKREQTQSRLDDIYTILDGLKNRPMEYDEQIVRQLLECITVDSKEQITVIFVGGLKVVQPLID